MTMKSANDIIPDEATHPGALLRETLESEGISQRELARRMGRPAPAINEIVRGKKRVTAETALELEQVLGIPASIWVNLQARYDLVLATHARAQR
ncbi:MAG TPA: HigA family addiction module antitoxin [Dehalococcoidia bacterium]|nr:HigA family addiction module antitoxin [Dehalococcoidia bacterium]